MRCQCPGCPCYPGACLEDWRTRKVVCIHYASKHRPADLDRDPWQVIDALPSRQDYLKKLVDAETCTKAQAVEYALICAEPVLHIFEEKFPEDKRPRQALEAARKWLQNQNPTEANRIIAYRAYAHAAADAAKAAYAAQAAYAAANAANAAHAANAAYAAAQAADAAEDARLAAVCPKP